MKASFDWSKYEKPEAPESAEKSFDWSKYESEPSRGRSIASAPVKGLIKGGSRFNPLGNFGPVPQELGERLTEKFLPTQNKPTEQVLERAGELLPSVAIGPEGIAAKAIQLAGGTALGHLAKENEAGPVGQAVAEAAGVGLPGLIKGGVKAVKGALTSPKQTMASGLSKPRAVDAKHAARAIIHPETQEKAIKKLEDEASQLAKKTVEKELPITKKIEEGFDFENQYERKFGAIRKMAEKANPEIDITPVSNYLSKNVSKYRGIPKLHAEGAKVKKEILAFQNRPQTGMKNLLRIYRSNNQKISSIYETSRFSGKQKEYVDFLVGMNREIAQSFENSLPKDSAWMKNFREMNADYKNYKNAKKTLDLLEPILGGKATPANLEKLSTDKKTMQKLAMAMGEKGANEISQLSKDLKQAVQSLKDIKAKDLKAWDTLIPLSLFIPHTHGIGTAIGLKKSAEFARRGYGYFLSTAARRKDYEGLLKAISKKDKDSYVKYAKRLLEDRSEKDQ